MWMRVAQYVACWGLLIDGFNYTDGFVRFYNEDNITESGMKGFGDGDIFGPQFEVRFAYFFDS